MKTFTRFILSFLFALTYFSAKYAYAQCPVIACPPNIVVDADPGTCEAIVNFSPPQGGCLGNVVFNYTGAVQTFVVPSGVTSLNITALGAQGGADSPVPGGLGGSVSGVLSVVPVTTVYIYVGGKGVDGPGTLNCNQPGGWNGGGGTGAVCCSNAGGGAGSGGGASDIRYGGTTLNDRVLVAGGGGGAGDGQMGANAGGLVGANGGTYAGVTATGGSQSAGGIAGGTFWPSHTCDPATAGVFGIGGAGDGNDGGGGGGGWYGGGGGANNGAGAGGSSYIGGAGISSGVINTSANTGDGSVTINYIPPSTSIITTKIAGLDSGAVFPVGTTVQTYVATDGMGGFDTCSFNITVRDKEKPVPAGDTLEDVVAGCEVTLTPPTAQDNCSGTVTATTPFPTTYSIIGTYTVVWKFDDGNGNIQTAVQNVIVDKMDAGVSQVGNDLVANNPNATYQWIDCIDNAVIPGATSRTFKPTINGKYAVWVTEKSCTDTSECILILYAGLDQDNFSSGITMAPNPTNDKVTISIKGDPAAVRLSVYDLKGQIFLERSFGPAEPIVFSTNDYAPGVYMVKVESEQNVALLKLLKQ